MASLAAQKWTIPSWQLNLTLALLPLEVHFTVYVSQLWKCSESPLCVYIDLKSLIIPKDMKCNLSKPNECNDQDC